MLQLDDDVESTMGGKDVRMRQQLIYFETAPSPVI
jgi:hypothetical protein